ncbi:hypothetical protein AZE42_11038, partial [Rhizopogon vesiculosus]
DEITSIATFPDGERIVTGSADRTIRIWRLGDGREIKKWVVKNSIDALVILRDGKQVVSAEGVFSSGDLPWGQLCVRGTETGKVVAGPLNILKSDVVTLELSPDGGILANGHNRAIIFWDTTTWQPTTGQVGVATSEAIQILDVTRREVLAKFSGHADFNNSWNRSLTWTPDGAHLLSAGSDSDPVIRCWDTSTWKQAGVPWIGHDRDITHLILNPA